jgi:AcrR family transcriptional regulator
MKAPLIAKPDLTTKQDRRDALVDLMADHLLAHGLGAASLRPLAAAAGTSDRMLLYYFADKEAILTAVFGRIAERFAPLLAGGETGPVSPAALRARLWRQFRAEAAQPFIRLYLELCMAACRGEQPHRMVAAGMAEAFLAFAGAQLAVADEAERAVQAALVVAQVDGLLLLDGIGLSAITHESARWGVPPVAQGTLPHNDPKSRN